MKHYKLQSQDCTKIYRYTITKNLPSLRMSIWIMKNSLPYAGITCLANSGISSFARTIKTPFHPVYAIDQMKNVPKKSYLLAGYF